METKEIMYSREVIVSSLKGILDRVNHGSVSVYDTPRDEAYFDGFRDAIKGLLVNFGENRFDTGKEVRRPTVVCLCGSVRFKDAFMKAYREETLAGKIVLSVGVMLHQGDDPISSDDPRKAGLDELHLRKIDIADEILVLNIGGYVGDSTAREIAYAKGQGKIIKYIEERSNGD